MIFQLSDWFPKPMIWAIIVKFDQIRKVGKNFFAASSVKKCYDLRRFHPKKIKKTAWKFTKTVILLGLAGYELIQLGLRPRSLYIYQLISGASSKNNVKYYSEIANQSDCSKHQDHWVSSLLMNMLFKGSSCYNIEVKVRVTLIFFYFRRKVEALTNRFFAVFHVGLRRKMYDMCAFEMPLRFWPSQLVSWGSGLMT